MKLPAYASIQTQTNSGQMRSGKIPFKPQATTLQFGQQDELTPSLRRAQTLDRLRKEAFAKPILSNEDRTTYTLGEVFQYLVALETLTQSGQLEPKSKNPWNLDPFEDLSLLSCFPNNVYREAFETLISLELVNKDKEPLGYPLRVPEEGMQYAQQHGYIPENPVDFLRNLPQARADKQKADTLRWLSENWEKNQGNDITCKILFSLFLGIKEQVENKNKEKIRSWKQNYRNSEAQRRQDMATYQTKLASIPFLFRFIWKLRNPEPRRPEHDNDEQVTQYLEQMGDDQVPWVSDKPTTDQIVGHPYFLKPQLKTVKEVLLLLKKEGLIDIKERRNTYPAYESITLSSKAEQLIANEDISLVQDLVELGKLPAEGIPAN